MARRKRTPAVSTLTRQHTVAYARKQKGDKEAEGKDDDDKDEKDEKDDKDPAASDADLVKAALATMKFPPQPDAPPDRPTMPFDPAMLANAGAEPEPVLGRVPTVSMPTLGAFGAPPEIPLAPEEAIVIKGGAVENPTHMPGPRDIPPGEPDDVASPPGHVPKGDSRSLRRRGDKYEFALVYRRGNAVISRVGIVGTRGVWRVVEYPTTGSASNAYAREASRFVTDGFSDYRE